MDEKEFIRDLWAKAYVMFLRNPTQHVGNAKECADRAVQDYQESKKHNVFAIVMRNE